jgi:hypothetical protein
MAFTTIPALSYLPPVEIAVAAGSTFSARSLNALLNKVAQMQDQGTPNGTYNNERCNTTSPFSQATWNIVVNIGDAGGDYQCTFVSEVDPQSDPIGRPALSSRRDLDISIVANGNEFTVRSAQAALNQVLKFEDKVAQTDNGAQGDGTYTDLPINGPTPFEQYVWTIQKTGNVYVLTPTVNS